MKAKKKEMILQAWESLGIKEEAEATYGKPVPLNRKVALSIWKLFQKNVNHHNADDTYIENSLWRLSQLQLRHLIRVDSLAGGGQSEIGQSSLEIPSVRTAKRERR